MRFLIRTVINMFGLWLADLIVPGMHLADDSSVTLVFVALAVGLVNAFIRPIIRILTFPITILTLGLFTFIINAFMLLIVGMLPWLHFAGDPLQMFLSALLGSLVISVVSMVASWFLPDMDT